MTHTTTIDGQPFTVTLDLDRLAREVYRRARKTAKRRVFLWGGAVRGEVTERGGGLYREAAG